MLSERFRFPFVLGVGVALLALAAAARAQSGPARGKAAATTPAHLADEQAGQVVVTYLNDELTIKARNVPLIDVLNAVGRQTGAQLDISSVDGHEPIVANLGPGPAREVLASLLNSRGLNYAMGGSADDPKALGQVFILPRSYEADAPSSVTAPPVAPIPVAQPNISAPRVASVERQKRISEEQKQIKELFAQERAELPADADADAAANFFNQLEAQMMAAAQDGSLDGGPPGAAAASDTLGNTTPIADLPPGRPRHR
jgi:hypothetical protein